MKNRKKSKVKKNKTSDKEENGPNIDFLLNGEDSSVDKKATHTTFVPENPAHEELRVAENSIQPHEEEHDEVSMKNDDTQQEKAENLSKLNIKEAKTMSHEEAMKILEKFFTVLCMGGISISSILKSHIGERLTGEHLYSIFKSNDPSIELVSIEEQAFEALEHVNGSSDIDIAALYEFAMGISFKIELAEYQIRTMILSKADKNRGKCDYQRTVNRLLAHLDQAKISSKDFERVLEEKLALKFGNFMTRILFARIIRRRFQRNFPSVLEETKTSFCSLLEQFCGSPSFSEDTFEGKLRQLLSRQADLRQSFQALDRDKSGTLSMEEFICFLQEQGFEFPESILRSFIKRFDLDGDGTLNYHEFMDFIKPKRFGINVLTPFGMFYLAADPSEKMHVIVKKIKTRLFWLQHNDLFNHAAEAMHAASKANSDTNTNDSVAEKTKYKVSDSFFLTHHFGMLKLQYEEKDEISQVLRNGELVVLIFYDPIAQMKLKKRIDGFGREIDPPLPPFEFKLKPHVNRTIPDLRKIGRDLVEQYAQDEYGIDPRIEEKLKTLRTPVGVLPRPPPPKEMYLSRAKRSPPMEMATDLSERTIIEWTPQDVKRWLIYKVELAKYVTKFVKFVGQDLLQIDEVFLRDVLDITSKPDRIKLLEEIDKLRRKKKEVQGTRTKVKASTNTRKTRQEIQQKTMDQIESEDEEIDEELKDQTQSQGKGIHTMIMENDESEEEDGEKQVQEQTKRNHQKIPAVLSPLSLKESIKVPVQVEHLENEEEYAYYSGSDIDKDQDQEVEEPNDLVDDENAEGDEALPAYLVDDNDDDEALPCYDG